MPGVPPADPGVQNYRTGLLKVTRMSNGDLSWLVHDEQDYACCGARCLADLGGGISVMTGGGSFQLSQAAVNAGQV